MIVSSIEQMRIVADRLGSLSDEIPQAMGQILRGHGARIERDAKILAPVDRGFLMNSIRYTVNVSGNKAGLIVGTPMEYAAVQHEKPMHHPKPGARDHFIKIPFDKRIIRIVAEIKHAIKEAVEQ